MNQELSNFPLASGSDRELEINTVLPWWSGLVQCNPFYLFSALLLIYGVYRASVDPHFFSTETAQWLFNFGALQIYGVMLCGTVILLARRRIWYDATLLIFLDNILVLIPFILLSHAIFLGAGLSWAMCALAVTFAAIKFGAFQRFFSGLNLPKGLVVIGVLVLLANAAIPLVFRHGLEFNNELWTERSVYYWRIFLPALVFSGLLLPVMPERPAPADSHQKPWIPLAIFALWVAGTAVHLYSVGYVDDQRFELARFSALLWAFAWLACAKITPALRNLTHRAGAILLFFPALATALALSDPRPGVFIILNLLNGAIYAVIACRKVEFRIAAALGGASLGAAFFGVPSEWITPVVAGYNKMGLIIVLVLLAGIASSLRCRTPRSGVLGAVCAALLSMLAAPSRDVSIHLAGQVAPLFYLLHSLIWRTNQEPGSTTSLWMAAILWLADSLIFSSVAGLSAGLLHWLPYLGAFTGVLLSLLARLTWRRGTIPLIASLLVTLGVPAAHSLALLRQAPFGLLAVSASFLLFLAGTGFAFARRNLFSAFIGQRKEKSSQTA